MTYNNTEAREAFEKWARSRNYDCDTPHTCPQVLENPLNPYGDKTTNHCFQAWQAALSTLPREVTMDEAVKVAMIGYDTPFHVDDCYAPSWILDEVYMRNAIRALADAGMLKVRNV